MNSELLERILSSSRLPSLPAVAMRVVDLCRDDNASIKQLAEIVSHDPALATKLLKTINSSYYGLRHRITNVQQAVSLLGLNEVKMLALSFSILPMLRTPEGLEFDASPLWLRSLFSAVAARALARDVRLAHQEEVFVIGLVQDIGVMAQLQSLRGEYVGTLSSHMKDHAALWKAERKARGLDHAQVGAALAEKWHLPELLVEAIRHHERPDKAPSETRQLLWAVDLGAIAAESFLQGREVGQAQTYFVEARKRFDLEQNRAAGLLEQAYHGCRELAKIFNLEARAMRNPAEVIAEANEMLCELSLQASQAAAELEQQNRALAEQSKRDGLTGVNHRGAFDPYFEMQVKRCVGEGLPLSAVFLDADKFKDLNDQHGHAVGDKVLRAIASLLLEHTPENAFIARYGGEEFTVTLPGRGLRESVAMAEGLRRRVEAMKIQPDAGASLTVTVSIGVAAWEPGEPELTAAQLIDAADQAMYAAKAAGRNQVRVYRPPNVSQARVA